MSLDTHAFEDLALTIERLVDADMMTAAEAEPVLALAQEAQAAFKARDFETGQKQATELLAILSTLLDADRLATINVASAGDTFLEAAGAHRGGTATHAIDVTE